MNYLNENKGWRYHVKSFLATFFPIFSALLVAQFLTYDFSSLNAQEITFATVGAGLLSFLRSAFVLLLIALQMAFKKK